MIKWLKKRKIRSKKNFDLHKRGVAAFFIKQKISFHVSPESK